MPMSVLELLSVYASCCQVPTLSCQGSSLNQTASILLSSLALSETDPPQDSEIDSLFSPGPLLLKTQTHVFLRFLLFMVHQHAEGTFLFFMLVVLKVKNKLFAAVPTVPIMNAPLSSFIWFIFNLQRKSMQHYIYS